MTVLNTLVETFPVCKAQLLEERRLLRVFVLGNTGLQVSTTASALY